MANEEKMETVEEAVEEVKAAEEPAKEAEEKKAEEKTEKPEEKAEKSKEKAEKPKKEKKKRKPFFFDTAATSGGLVGRCILIFLHAAAIAYALIWIVGFIDGLLGKSNASPALRKYAVPLAMILGGLAIVYGIARIVCVVVCFNKRKKA